MHERMYKEAEKIADLIEKETRQEKIDAYIQRLRELEVVPAAFRVRWENGNIDGKKIKQGLIQKWKSEKDEHCRDEENDIKQNVRIGTEFTFHHPEFLFTMEDLEKNNSGKGIEKGNRIIAEWTADLLERYPYQKPLSGLKITAEKTGHGHKKYTEAAYEAVEIRFEIEDTLQGRTFSWKVNFDLDPSCIELQADPMPYCFFEEYGYCINELLFRHLDTYGLVADKNMETGGGGHISLDVPAAFSGNAVYLRNFLVLYSCETMKASIEKSAKEKKEELTEEQKKWNQNSFLEEKQRKLLVESEDVANAPFLFEKTGEWVPFRAFIAAFDQQQADMEQFVRGMHKKVYVGATSELEAVLGGAANVKAEDKWHYQAVNLEHVHDDKRIELRRFDAQANIDELLQQAEALFQILMMARTNWKISIDKALESDYFAV